MISPPDDAGQTVVVANKASRLGLGEATATWAKVAVNSFGGPAGQIAVMHRFLVEERHWISERRFLHALNYCMLLPGPEAQQLAIYIGWLLNGIRGGVIAGWLFVLPGFLAILGLSVAYVTVGDVAAVEGLLFGLQAAVVAVVAEAVRRIGRRALRGPAMVALAVAAFVAIFFFEVPFPLIVLGAALVGLVGGRLWPRHLGGDSEHEARMPTDRTALLADDQPRSSRAANRAAVKAAAGCAVLWLVPLGLLVLLAGSASVFTQEAVLFSQTAVVTFGGAYAVLGYIAQQAVTSYGWLRPQEMLTGLALAETTPGPLIMVVQYVGFLAAYRNPGPFEPMVAGIVGSVVTVWMTFLPCFFFIFGGAPLIERLRHNRALSSALAGITAAVVGVVGNLAVWFAVQTAFERVDTREVAGARLLIPEWDTVDLASLGLTAVAVVALFKLRLSVLKTLGLCGAGGLAWALIVGG